MARNRTTKKSQQLNTKAITGEIECGIESNANLALRTQAIKQIRRKGIGKGKENQVEPPSWMIVIIQSMRL